MSSTRLQFHVYVDFDGTIVPKDATDRILEAYALPEWLVYEDAFQSGRITSRECLAKQVDLLRATPEQFDAVVDSVEPDPDFARFVRICRAEGAAVSVVSDGMDRAVQRVLSRVGVQVPFRANALKWQGGDRWALEFPYLNSGCAVQAGNCKCSQEQALRSTPGLHRSVIVGDGRSDFCLASRVDLVLAKARLLDHCRETGLPHLPFETFAEAIDLIGGWIEGWQDERANVYPRVSAMVPAVRARTG